MKTKCQVMKRIVTLFLVAAMLVGCSPEETEAQNIVKVTPMEKEASRALSFSFLGGQDVMPITGYYGPYSAYVSKDGNLFPNYVSDEIMKMFADAGINLIVYSDMSYSSTPDLVQQYLELGEKYNIGIFVTDGNVLNKVGDTEVSAAEVADQVTNYADYSAFCGMYLVDEPRTAYYMPGDTTKYISNYKNLAKVLQYDLDLTCYMNMFPVWNLKTSKDKYEQYVKEFCETLNPKVLMWDNYPFSSSEGLEVYFYNMNLMREYAEKNNIPFWAFIQAGAQWNDEMINFDSKTPYFPNENQFNWNVNTCLAFGAQGIQYFPLVQPAHFAYAESTEWDFERNGIIGAAGNKTMWYNFAQNINKHIEVIDGVLMNSVNKGVIITGEQAKKDMELAMSCVIESGAFQELQSVTGDAMVGCFNYNGKTALYVVNYSMKYAQQITLNLNDTHDVTVMQNAETSYVKTKNLQLDMAAGEGVLVVIE